MPQVASVTTTTASTTDDQLEVEGEVSPDGETGDAWFEYSTDAGLATYTTTPRQAFTATPDPLTVTAQVPNLARQTTFYARLVAESADGSTLRGAILSAVTGSPTSSKIELAIDYLVSRIKALAGHDRVYGRKIAIREDADRIALLLDEYEHIDCWEVHSRVASRQWVGTRSIELVHQVECKLRRHLRRDVDSEQLARAEAEAVALDLGWDHTLGGLVEQSKVLSVPVDEVMWSEVLVHVATVRLQVTELLHRL